MKEIKQENFTLDLFFQKNFGLEKRPAMPELKKKGIVWGAILVVLGIILAAVSMGKENMGAVVGIGIIVLLFGALLIALPIIKKVTATAYRDKWDAEFNRRLTEWGTAFDNERQRIIDELKLEEKGRDYLGIDVDNLIKDEKGEASAFYISGNNFDGAWRRITLNGVSTYRTENQEITWLYFGTDQLYIYKTTFSLRNPNAKHEESQEFFYKDIVSVSVAQESITPKSVDLDAEDESAAAKDVESERFRLVVPGDKLSFAYTPTPYTSGRINAMKSMIRDKKTH